MAWWALLLRGVPRDKRHRAVAVHDDLDVLARRGLPLRLVVRLRHARSHVIPSSLAGAGQIRPRRAGRLTAPRGLRAADGVKQTVPEIGPRVILLGHLARHLAAPRAGSATARSWPRSAPSRSDTLSAPGARRR